eukprot:507432_1
MGEEKKSHIVPAIYIQCYFDTEWPSADGRYIWKRLSRSHRHLFRTAGKLFHRTNGPDRAIRKGYKARAIDPDESRYVHLVERVCTSEFLQSCIKGTNQYGALDPKYKPLPENVDCEFEVKSFILILIKLGM